MTDEFQTQKTWDSIHKFLWLRTRASISCWHHGRWASLFPLQQQTAVSRCCLVIGIKRFQQKLVWNRTKIDQVSESLWINPLLPTCSKVSSKDGVFVLFFLSFFLHFLICFLVVCLWFVGLSSLTWLLLCLSCFSSCILSHSWMYSCKTHQGESH